MPLQPHAFDEPITFRKQLDVLGEDRHFLSRVNLT